MAAITRVAKALQSATTNVDVSAATAPSSGQVLTATGTTAATWQTPSGGAPGFKFKSYTTATDATSVQVTGLDLDTKKAYKVIVKADQGSVGTTRLRMTVNNDSTGNYYYNRWGISAAGAAITSQQTAQSNWELSNSNSENHYAELMIYYKETATDGVHISGQSMGSNGASEVPTYTLNFGGSGGFTTNVTTIEFLGGGAATDWKVWVFELATS